MAVISQATEVLPRLPLLEAGECLDQATFHERYKAMPAAFRAELIGGMVIVSSPLSRGHSVYHTLVITWLGHYWLATPGTSAWDNVTTILSAASELQPDAALLIEPACGGQTGLTADDYITGAPELVVEVAVSSSSIDLHAKRRAYEQAGVLEYLVVVVRQRLIRRFMLQQGAYQEQAADADGMLRSHVFPGLWLHAEALLQLDGVRLMEVLQQGLATPEHAGFVHQLRQQRGVS